MVLLVDEVYDAFFSDTSQNIDCDASQGVKTHDAKE